MRVLLAPDSFKGSLSAVRFCQLAHQVIQHTWPNIDVVSRPLSDGGEGFVDAIVSSGLAAHHTVPTLDPLGRPIHADFAWQESTKTAFIEMAQSSGLMLLQTHEYNPLITSTFGTGLVINHALGLGAKKIVLGLGGSATNDGGAGALQALGFEFFDINQQPIPLGGEGLLQLNQIGKIPSALKSIEWILACDVTNPLLGKQGATAVYSAQKGATLAMQDVLEHALTHFAQCLEQHSAIKHTTSISTRPGAGAAGGMGAGFIGLLNAKTHSGFDLLSDAVGLEQVFDQKIDWVITGEGRLDSQTQHGKLPLRMAQLAARYAVPTIAICGQIDLAVGVMPEFHAGYSLVNEHVSPQEAMRHTEKLFEQRVQQAVSDILISPVYPT